MPLTMAIELSGKSIIGAVAGGYLAIAISKRALGYRRSTGACGSIPAPRRLPCRGTDPGRIGCG